jgi:hypothetical protein
MKKLLIIFAGFLVLNGYAQQDKTWSLGLQWGFHANHSDFKGGMENANARFHHNSYGGGGLQLIARYDYTKHWMLMTGLGFNTYGFDFALSENYSLLKEDSRFSTIHTGFGALELPTLVYYKFNPNCRNSKYVIGGGFVHSVTGAQTIPKNFVEDPEGNTNSNYLESVSTVKDELNCMIRLVVGKERVFKRRNILNAALILNVGLKEIATSKVIYTVDGQEYNHEFGNSGNFVGLRLAYFFRPFQKALR